VVFDIEVMILSMLSDPELMKEENLAKGVDIFTGKETEPSQVYGEIHTGSAWSTAVKFHCKGKAIMPLGLVLFGDKSHYDLHGSLSTIPISFTLSIFNRKLRHSPKFMRPLAYIPNLSHERFEKGNENKSRDSVRDEHRCLHAAL
jgi:hypothetical protein